MSAMYKITYGLFVITAKDEKMNGCVINTLAQVTSTPNRVSVTINKENYTTKQIEKTKKFNVSILDKNTDFELIKHFGFASGKTTNKFEGFKDYKIAENGLPFITKNSNAYLSCEVFDQKDLGTHIMFFADVVKETDLSNETSLTYEFYQSNIKPKNESNKVCYVCSVCGYVYEGDEIPDDYLCPLCKHDKSFFVKQTNENKPEKKEEKSNKKYVCPICGYVHEGDGAPERCPICGVEMKEA